MQEYKDGRLFFMHLCTRWFSNIRTMYGLLQLGFGKWKLRISDCYVSCNKEEWANEISSKYDTTYHADYVFQKITIIFG